jgi:hypothetical protein
MDLSFQNCSILNYGIALTKVCCSILNIVVFKNFVSKQGLIMGVIGWWAQERWAQASLDQQKTSLFLVSAYAV